MLLVASPLVLTFDVSAETKDEETEIICGDKYYDVSLIYVGGLPEKVRHGEKITVSFKIKSHIDADYYEIKYENENAKTRKSIGTTKQTDNDIEFSFEVTDMGKAQISITVAAIKNSKAVYTSNSYEIYIYACE